MSAVEKLFVHIFDEKKRIIDQAQRQCDLFDQHLLSKFLLQGIAPPPWLTNTVLPSLSSDPKDLNEDGLIVEAPYSRPQSTIPFSHGNLVATTDDAQPQGCSQSEFHALEKESDARDGLSNLHDCSVNNVGHSSIIAPEMDSGDISPQNQMESRNSLSYNYHALSLAKLQRSKSRQRALELRSSAKAANSCLGDDNNDGVFDTNTQSCAIKEVKRSDRLPQKHDQSNYSGRTTRSKAKAAKSCLGDDNNDGVFDTNIQICAMKEVKRSVCLAQKHDQSNCSDRTTRSEAKATKSCLRDDNNDGVSDTNIQSCAMKEVNRSDRLAQKHDQSNYSGRITRSERLARELNSLNMVNSSIVKEDGPKSNNAIDPFELIDPPCIKNESCSAKDTDKGDYPRRETESSVDHKILRRSRSASQGKDDYELLKPDTVLVRGTEAGVHDLMQSLANIESTVLSNASDCSNLSRMNTTEERSIRKLTKSPQPSVLQHSQASAVPVVSSFRSPKDPDLCAIKSKEVKNKSQNLQDTEVAAERSSSSKKDSKLETEIAMDSAEVAVVAACRNTKALTTCKTEGPLNRMNSSNLDGRDSVHTDSTSNKCLIPKSLLVESVVAEKELETQENVIADASATDVIDDRSAANVVRADTDFDVVVAKNNVCSASSPKVGMDVLVSGPPSDFMSVKPKQLDFDDVEGLTMSELSSTDLKMGEQDIPPEKVTIVCQDKCSFSTDMPLLDRQEVVIRQDEPQLNTCESHLKQAELPTVQKEFCTNTSIESQEIPRGASSSVNHSIPSQVAYENSSGSSQKEVIAFKFVSEISYLENDECNSKILENASSVADTGNISLTQQAPSSSICLHQINNLSKGKGFDDLKDAGFSTDMEHSCPQQKRKKIESQAERSLSASPSLLEKPHESNNQRLVGGNLNAKEDSREAVIEVQHLNSCHEDVENLCVSDSPTEEMQKTEGCHIKEGASLERFVLDERDRTVDTFLTFKSNELGDSLVSCLTEQDSSYSRNCLKKQMVAANLAVSDIGSTKRFTIDKNVDSWNDERSHSGKRICPEGNAKLSDGSSVSQGIQSWDMIGMEETNPEIEGFVIQPVDARPSIPGDHIELEKLNFPSDTIEYASILKHLGKSSFMHSPTPYRLHKIPDLYQSLPNGLVEGMMGTRSSLPLNDEIGKSLSDCQPYCKDQSTSGTKRTWASPIQTLWDRFNSKFSTSGKRESLKSELPCIDEENEAADEIANTFQEGIGPGVMTTSIIREPLAEITDDSKPSSSVSQDYVAREISLSGTRNQVKQKLEKEDAGRRFTGKGKENQSISRGAKLSGKISMKNGANYSGKKSTRNNIVSNITSFIPLVQQKQAAEVITGKRDIKVKALEAAEAAKRMAEKKENERKMRKEAAKRERLEQNNLRQQELVERKKKEAEMVAKKRQREEEEERKEKERKRRRVDEAKRKQQEHEEKMCAKKGEKEAKLRAAAKEAKFRAAGGRKHESKECIDGREKCKNSENNEDYMKISLDEHLTIKDPTNDKTKESLLQNYEAVNDCGNTAKVIGKTIKATEDDDLTVQNTIQEQSYYISPYKCSDDEEEEECHVNKKFVPSWSSKYRLSLAVSSQKLEDRETIFPMESFCSLSLVLLPRKLQVK